MKDYGHYGFLAEDPQTRGTSNLTLTHGKRALAIQVQNLNSNRHAAVKLTPDKARELAAKLIEFANEINPVSTSRKFED